MVGHASHTVQERTAVRWVMRVGGQTAALVKLKKQTRSTESGNGEGRPSFPGPPSLRANGSTVSFPGKFISHVQAESSCSHHWWPLGEWVCVVRRKEELQQAGDKTHAPEPVRAHTLHPPVSSGQAPACYCLKPHSPVPMEQMGGRRAEGSFKDGDKSARTENVGV